MDNIEKQAVFFRNYHLLHPKYKAVIHLEDKEDEYFWDIQLQKSNPALYKYIHYSKSNKGINSSGCEQCLKYIPYLSHTFFVCIDSDLRLLRGETDLNPQRYVAQTHTYSWENHVCQAEQLQRRFAAKTHSTTFDFCSFLTELSHIVYRPLLYLVDCSKSATTNKLWNIKKFNACIPNQLTSDELRDNVQSYLDKVRDNFEKAMNPLTLPEPDVVSECNADNAYLHIQGHQLYDLLLYIGTRLCSGTGISFKSQILDTASHTEGYAEIDSLQSDLNVILRF